MAATKTVCTVSRSEFKTNARPVTVDLNGQKLSAMPRTFQTGSLGYYANGKVTLDVGGVPVVFQCGITLTAVGSKDLED